METNFIAYFKGNKISALIVILLCYTRHYNNKTLKADLKLFKNDYNINDMFNEWITQYDNIIRIFNVKLKSVVFGDIIYNQKLTPIIRHQIVKELLIAFIERHKI